MAGLIGAGAASWIFVTFILFGFAAAATGRALAVTWRPLWQAVPYVLLLAASSRFILFSLFGGELLHLAGLLVGWAILLAIAFLAYRVTMAQQMVRQYPWLYQRDGLLGWRSRPQ